MRYQPRYLYKSVHNLLVLQTRINNFIFASRCLYTVWCRLGQWQLLLVKTVNLTRNQLIIWLALNLLPVLANQSSLEMLQWIHTLTVDELLSNQANTLRYNLCAEVWCFKSVDASNSKYLEVAKLIDILNFLKTALEPIIQFRQIVVFSLVDCITDLVRNVF